jgi:hypothetical protein
VPGILYLLTFGVCGVGQLIDLFLIPGEVRSANLHAASQGGSQQNIVVHVGDTTTQPEPINVGRKNLEATKTLSLEHRILQECSNPHPISLSQIIIATGEPIEQIKKVVKELSEQELLTQTINEDGVILYKTQ